MSKAASSARTQSTKPLHQLRLKNLKHLIDLRFEGNSTQAARAIERSHTFMWQLVNGYRAIGEASARHIEEKLKLAPNSLDAKSMLDRTEVLVAHLGNGEARSYRMTPRLDLDHMNAKPQEWRPCPAHTCSEDAFYVEITTEHLRELHLGELAFADRKEAKHLTNGKLYVVAVKDWKPNKATVLLARKHAGDRWHFISTSEQQRRPDDYPLDQVRVIARVIHVVRDL